MSLLRTNDVFRLFHRHIAITAMRTQKCLHALADTASDRSSMAAVAATSSVAIDESLTQEPAIMKTKQLFAIALSAGIASVAFAESYGPGDTYLPDQIPMVVVKTRAQVQAELAEARRAGLIVYGDADIPEEHAPMVIVKTRAQVEAELAEARRLGLIRYGEGDVAVATPEQEWLISEAGRRAVAQVATK
jgi:hypothetical protein